MCLTLSAFRFVDFAIRRFLLCECVAIILMVRLVSLYFPIAMFCAVRSREDHLQLSGIVVFQNCILFNVCLVFNKITVVNFVRIYMLVFITWLIFFFSSCCCGRLCSSTFHFIVIISWSFMCEYIFLPNNLHEMYCLCLKIVFISNAIETH